LSPNDGIKVLADKSLISIDKFGTLIMHDLLQDMGREISRRDAPKEPPKDDEPGFVFLCLKCLAVFFMFFF
jgi:hypothetical protein